MNEKEKKAVEEAIYELEDSYELHQREWAKKCLNTIKQGFTKLKEENEHNKLLLNLNNNFTIDKKNGNYKWNVIEIQKIKDKIEKEIKYHEKNILDIENITMLKSKTAKEEAEIEFNKYAIVVLNKMLQELIEEREEKAE